MPEKLKGNRHFCPGTWITQNGKAYLQQFLGLFITSNLIGLSSLVRKKLGNDQGFLFLGCIHHAIHPT